jgi:hypothetical protein
LKKAESPLRAPADRLVRACAYCRRMAREVDEGGVQGTGEHQPERVVATEGRRSATDAEDPIEEAPPRAFVPAASTGDAKPSAGPLADPTDLRQPDEADQLIDEHDDTEARR